MTSRRIPTEIELEYIRNKNLMGTSYAALGKEYGVSKVTIRNWVIYGLPKIKRLEDLEIEEIRKLNGEGKSLVDIAKMFGVSKTCIHMWVHGTPKNYNECVANSNQFPDYRAYQNQHIKDRGYEDKTDYERKRKERKRNKETF